jgi:hypothetical protein
LVAFARAGADCLFAPGVRDAASIAAIVKAVAPESVNVVMSAPVPGLTLARLANLGVRRVSVGSSLARMAWGGFLRAASPDGVLRRVGGVPFGRLDAVFQGGHERRATVTSGQADPTSSPRSGAHEPEVGARHRIPPRPRAGITTS